MTTSQPLPSFRELGVDEPICETLRAMGFTEPMEVQAAALKPIMEGKDVLVQAHTGSGKTAAFAIPLAQSIDQPPGDDGPLALVLVPTRELALQVATECERIGAGKGLRVVPIYGGAPIRPQRAALAEGVGLVVGTPGRILDHMGRRWLRLDRIRSVVLDECDEMLSRGFLEDIERILDALPRPRQTLLFSATIPAGIARLAERHQVDPVRIDLSGDRIGAADVRHFVYLVTGGSRPKELLAVLEQERPESALIFCNTRDETATVASYLKRHGLDAEPISSDLTQKDRERVMARMKKRTLPFLVATDVAARGIDITGLDLVLNYSFPEAPDLYVHRTGRTGRAGRPGVAISLVSPKELGSLYYLRLVHKIRPEERHLPTDAERRARWETERFAELARTLPKKPAMEFVALAKRIWQSAEAERFVAGLLERHVARAGKPSSFAARDARQKPADAAVEPDEPRASANAGRADEATVAPLAGPTVHADAPTLSTPASDRAADELESTATAKPRDFWERWAESKGSVPDETSPHGAALPGPIDHQENGADESMETSSEENASDVPMARLYLNVGRKEGVRASDIVTLLREGASLSRKDLGRIQVRDSHTYASVRAETAKNVIESLRGREFRGRILVVERARR